MTTDVSRRFVEWQKKFLTRLMIAMFVLPMLIWVLQELRYQGVLGRQAYFLVLGSALSTAAVLGGLWARRALPPGLLVMSEKSRSILGEFGAICDMVPGVAAKNHWKLLEADKQRGHFKAKIGMSPHTYSSTVMIDVSKLDGGSVNVHVLCGTRSLYADRYVERMVDKFHRELGDSLKNSKA